MSDGEKSISEGVEIIRKGRFDVEGLRFLREEIDRGGAFQIVNIAFLKEHALSDSDESVVEVLMDKLQELGGIDKLLACKLMSVLWHFSSDTYAHHVSDGITLWIAHNKSPELTAFLDHLASTAENEEMKKSWERLRKIPSATKS